MKINLEKVRERRMAKRISQGHMAEKMHIDRTSYTRLENGSSVMRFDYANEIFDILQISPDEQREFIDYGVSILEQKNRCKI